MEHRGMIHIYTGNGKGKTTAALGLALRAAGARKRVFIAQFVKGMPYAELHALRGHENITIKQFGRDCFIEKDPVEEDIVAAQKGFQEVQAIINSHQYDVIILDEIFIALYYKLIDSEELKKLITSKFHETEIVLTGRYATKDFYEIADLVTEMKKVKHYFDKGVVARLGIEY